MSTANDPMSNEWDVEAIVDRVSSNLDGRVPRSSICTTVVRLLKKYDDATIRIYIPILVSREATNSLRSVVSEELEAKIVVPGPDII